MAAWRDCWLAMARLLADLDVAPDPSLDEWTDDELAALLASLDPRDVAGDPVLAHPQRLISKASGFQFTAPSKERLMEGLAVAIQQGGVHYPVGVLTGELEVLEYEHMRTGMRYSAPEGLHDDCVCALAPTVQHGVELRHRPRITRNRTAVSAPRAFVGMEHLGWPRRQDEII